MAMAAPAIAGGSDVATAVTVEHVTNALRGGVDPELGMSLIDLGLICGIRIDGGHVALTAAGCPLHDVMSEWVRAAVTKFPAGSA
jgi:metal-sulfur cluster biosynthetic enzyme